MNKKDKEKEQELLHLRYSYGLRALHYLIRNGCGVEGIFRVSGGARDVKAIMAMIDAGKDPKELFALFEDQKRHYLFADIVKYVLQSEPDGLLNTTKEMAPKYYFYDFLLALVKELFKENPDSAVPLRPESVKRLQDMMSLVQWRHPLQEKFFHDLMVCSFQISLRYKESKMDAKNLAIVFGPQMFMPGPGDDLMTFVNDAPYVTYICSLLIIQYDTIFPAWKEHHNDLKEEMLKVIDQQMKKELPPVPGQLQSKTPRPVRRPPKPPSYALPGQPGIRGAASVEGLRNPPPPEESNGEKESDNTEQQNEKEEPDREDKEKEHEEKEENEKENKGDNSNGKGHEQEKQSGQKDKEGDPAKSNPKVSLTSSAKLPPIPASKLPPTPSSDQKSPTSEKPPTPSSPLHAPPASPTTTTSTPTTPTTPTSPTKQLPPTPAPKEPGSQSPKTRSLSFKAVSSSFSNIPTKLMGKGDKGKSDGNNTSNNNKSPSLSLTRSVGNKVKDDLHEGQNGVSAEHNEEKEQEKGKEDKDKGVGEASQEEEKDKKDKEPEANGGTKPKKVTKRKKSKSIVRTTSAKKEQSNSKPLKRVGSQELNKKITKGGEGK